MSGVGVHDALMQAALRRHVVPTEDAVDVPEYPHQRSHSYDHVAELDACQPLVCPLLLPSDTSVPFASYATSMRVE